MKKEEISPERLAIQRLAGEIHQANLKYERYTAKEFVTTTSIKRYRIGPWTLPGPFYSSSQVSRQQPVFSINPPEDTVVMVDDGQVAIRNPRNRQTPSTRRYEVFDFETGSPDDFNTVRVAIENWRRIPQNIQYWN